MSRCEEAASEIILAVLNQGKIELDESERRLIAEWAQLKAISWDALQTDRKLPASIARDFHRQNAYAESRPFNVSVAGARVSVDAFQPNVFICRRLGSDMFNSAVMRFVLGLSGFMVEVNFCGSLTEVFSPHRFSIDSGLATVWPELVTYDGAPPVSCELPLISHTSIFEGVHLVLID
jgi:hypothetical protein